MEKIIWLTPLLALIALLFAAYKAHYVSKAAPGNARMQEIASAIAEGANAFLIQFFSGNRPHRCTLRVHDFVRFPRYPMILSFISPVRARL